MVEPSDPLKKPVVSVLARGVGPPVRSTMPLFVKVPLTVGVPNTLTRPALFTSPETSLLVARTELVPKLIVPSLLFVRLPVQLDPLERVTVPVLLSRFPVQVPLLVISAAAPMLLASAV